jgi:hypothetical protein
MFQHERLDDALIACIKAALQPHAWRRMSVRGGAVRLVEGAWHTSCRRLEIELAGPLDSSS